MNTPRAVSHIADDSPATTRFTRRSALLAVSAAAGAAMLSAPVRSALAQDATPVAAVTTDYPETIITAVEYAFGMPATIAGGWIELTMRNPGEMDHQAILLAIPEGSTYEDILTTTEATVADFDTTNQADYRPLLQAGAFYGGPAAGPGGEGSVILYLDPGDYAVICPNPDDTGLPHYASGMIAQLTVTEPKADVSFESPIADGQVTLVDFAFDGIPSEVPSGPLTWQVVNNGSQIHELQILRLSEGVDAATALAILSTPPGGSGMGDATPSSGLDMGTPMAGSMGDSTAMAGPPFTAVTGAGAMSPGATNWLMLDLEAGDYLALCFVPDINSGMPHFAMGMAQPFTVS